MVFMTEYLRIYIGTDLQLMSDLFRVSSDVTDHFEELVPHGPPLGRKPTRVIHYESNPIVFAKGLPSTYLIGITINNREYNRWVYQFAHELTHVYCDPRITNWFIESICEMTSLYFLGYLAKKWITEPPYPHWSDYAVQFERYKDEHIEKLKERLHVSTDEQLNEKFHSFKRELKTPYERDQNAVVALKLLEFFVKNGTAWTLLPLLGLATDKTLVEGCFHENSIPDFDRLVVLASDDQKPLAIELKELMQSV